jgi:alpha-tubulin suppressor-like RCC1 family protein
LYAWGSNDFGALGDGTTYMRTIPVPVKIHIEQGKSITAAVAGHLNSFFIYAGAVYAFGLNDYGALYAFFNLLDLTYDIVVLVSYQVGNHMFGVNNLSQLQLRSTLVED